MDERTNLADHLMNPELQIFAQELQSNPSLRATRTDFQTVLQDYQLPPEDPLSQPYTDWQACLLYTDQIGSLSPNELFEHTPSLEEMLLKVSDQSSSTDLDSINPSIHQLTRQPSGTVQIPRSDMEDQHQCASIFLPVGSTVASGICGPSTMNQLGTWESPNAPPIAVINPLTNEMASSATATTAMTNQNPHLIKNHSWTVQAPIIKPVNDNSQVAVPTACQVSSTLDTPSAHPAVRSDSEEKSKAKKKRQRAERTTPSSSPSSSLVLEKKKQKTADIPPAREEYKLPPGNELRIQLFYQKHKVGDKKINSQDGFLVYHKKAWTFPNTGGNHDLANIEFPKLEESPQKLKMTKSQKKSTETLLDVMTKGVHIYHDESRNIYAQRFCQSHVICYSTDLGTNDTIENVLQRKDHLSQISLEQGKKVKVFDNNNFALKVMDKMVRKIPIKSPPPCIILSFGQTWQEGFPLSNNLVYMKITPTYQRVQYSVEETPSLDCDNLCLAMSISSLSSH